MTLSAIFICCVLHNTGHSYVMESPIDTASAPIMWGSHMSMIKCMGLTHTRTIISHNENSVCFGSGNEISL